MRRKMKWSGVALASLFLLAQLIQPARSNPVIDQARAMDTHLHLTPEIDQLFQRACLDCHSHDTRWPWHSYVAPVSWFVVGHVNHARTHLNFSDWAKYDEPRTDEQLKHICDWANAERRRRTGLGPYPDP